MRQKKVTIKEIAKTANVSVATVSRVINNYKWINPEIKERVLTVMRELHYVPNYNAVAMAKGRSDVIVIVVPNIMNPFFTAFVSTAMHTLQSAGYIPLVYETDNHAEEEEDLLMGNIGQMADGLISVTDCLSDEAIRDILVYYEEQRKPLLFVDRNIPASAADTLAHDNVGAVSDVVDYFVAAGHKKIAIIVGNQGESVRLDKLEGYRQGLEKNGIAFRQEYLRQGKWEFETGQQETAALLDLEDPPTAILAANNYICEGVLEELEQRGLKPGKDISLIGTEECKRDIRYFEKLGITNLRLTSEALAEQASQQIIRRLEALAAGQEELSHSKTVFKIKLIERDSVVNLIS